MYRPRRKRRLGFAALVAVLLLAISVAGCGSSSESSSGESSSGGAESTGRSGTLTVGMTGDTLSLNPINCAPVSYCYPAYDALIYETADGKFKPDLATSWKFSDAGHQTLLLTLRKGAHFTDGTELEGKAVAASMNLFRETPGPGQSTATPIDEVKATGKYTVTIHYSMPVTNYYAAWQLTAQNTIGSIVGPKGLKNTKSLETESDGVGPYKLDGSETTKGSVYTFVANPAYFNQAAIRYDKVVLKPIQNGASRMSAIQSGQIDWAQGIASTETGTAEAAGLRVSEGLLGSSPAGMPMLTLAQRESGPLADQRVRQAISYAVPREEIAAALYGEAAIPTSSVIAKGEQGYEPADTDLYAYDTDKAKKLLAEAGYPNGFTLEVLDASFFDPNNALGQALASALEKVGIKVKLTASDAEPGVVSQEILKKKYPAYIWVVSGGAGAFSLTYGSLQPGAFMNPFKIPLDKTLTDQIEKAAMASDEAEQDELMKGATRRLDEIEWAVPVAQVPSLQATRQEIQNVPDSFLTREFDPFGPEPEDNWYTADE